MPKPRRYIGTLTRRTVGHGAALAGDVARRADGGGERPTHGAVRLHRHALDADVRGARRVVRPLLAGSTRHALEDAWLAWWEAIEVGNLTSVGGILCFLSLFWAA